MADRWVDWKSELERLTPFAEEWSESRTENFVRTVLNIAVRKREQRAAFLRLYEEIDNLHARYRQVLTFFDLERACASWAASNCETTDVERVIAALTEWRNHIQNFSAKFPPAEDSTRTLSAMQACLGEAQDAASAIDPCFRVLDGLLGGDGAPVAEEQPAAVAAEAPAECALPEAEAEMPEAAGSGEEQAAAEPEPAAVPASEPEAAAAPDVAPEEETAPSAVPEKACAAAAAAGAEDAGVVEVRTEAAFAGGPICARSPQYDEVSAAPVSSGYARSGGETSLLHGWLSLMEQPGWRCR